MIGPSCRVSEKSVFGTMLGVTYWALFSYLKAKGMNNEKNKIIEINVQY